MAKFLRFILAASFLFQIQGAPVASAAEQPSPPDYSLLDIPRPELKPGAGVFLSAPLTVDTVGVADSEVAIAPVASAAEAPPSIFLAQQTGDAAGADEAAQKRSWRWRRAGGTEYIAVSVAAVGTAYFEHANGKQEKADWTSRNEFDEEIRSALRLESRSARDAIDLVGHGLMGLMIGAPVLDSLATLGIRDRDWDALWQTQMINLESFTLTSLVSSLTQNILARERPFVRDCRGGECEDRLENRGFPSGHVAFAFTGAGLICNHHRYQTLYNDPATDQAVCYTGIGLAVTDGILRLMADRHYATDVAAGTVLGLFSGFVLPRLLHYSHPVHREPVEKQGSNTRFIKQVRFVPMLSEGSSGVGCEFLF